jgi:hypothetical protein
VIYFAQLETGAIKIGRTEDLESRLQTLERRYGPVSVLKTIPGGVARERQIHERFAHLRLSQAEQFRPAADLMEFIGKPLLVSANADAIEAVKFGRGSIRFIRLDLSPADHKRVERAAGERGLTMASYARMAVLERLKADEGGQ